MKKVLIVGKGSYIGESIKNWLDRFKSDYYVEIVSSLNKEWKNTDFSQFETVIDLAGIAHINNITEDMRDLFYSVNRDLTIEIGTHAKENGVKHFIYFSSMNVYGDNCHYIQDREKVGPTSFYGDSKLQGDLGLEKLEDNTFSVAHVRPPFVYGKGCRGNYKSISKIAQKTPIFPTFRNRKSMIYIDNLCEFIRLLVNDGACGVFTPQNKELISTADLVAEVSKVQGHKIWFTSLFNWLIKPLIKVNSNIRRAFDDDCYSQEISNHYDNSYCVVNFEDSIIKTEL